MSIEEPRVKNEPICYTQSISVTRGAKRKSILANKVKEEPIDIEIQTSKSEEIKIKAEEKFSVREEFTKSISIAFLNEKTTTTNHRRTKQARTRNSLSNKPKSKVAKSDKRPYKCDICQKGFPAPSYLVTHQRTHTGERPYKCDSCKKSFTQSGDLDRHKRIHSGEKPFECESCKKSFTTSGNLQKHKRTHTGEKPYECEICQKSFSQSYTLQIHRRSHTGERPYKCDTCKKSFAQSSDLDKHKIIHNREKRKTLKTFHISSQLI